MITPLRAMRLILLLFLVTGLAASPALAHPHILRAASRSEVSPADLVRELAGVQVIFLGELHDHPGHHQAQLSLLKALRRERQPLTIAVEMFRKESQPALDRWVFGGMPLDRFRRDFDDNWSMWDKYREIFEFAREQKIPMVGLNIPRELSNRVARSGFAALPERERQALGNVRCVVTPEYGEFIRRAMGGHGGHGNRFLFFCEAQMLWDTLMARHLADYLKANPGHRVVVLAGSGHAWKFGIPRQLLEQMTISYRVMLPEVSGRLTREQMAPDITDYLWLDEGMAGWSF